MLYNKTMINLQTNRKMKQLLVHYLFFIFELFVSQISMIIDVQIKFVLYFVKLSVGSGFYNAHTHHSFIVFSSQSSLVRLSNLRLAVSHTFL